MGSLDPRCEQLLGTILLGSVRVLHGQRMMEVIPDPRFRRLRSHGWRRGAFLGALDLRRVGGPGRSRIHC